MRNAFLKTLLEQAHKDKRIILITGDLGFSVFEEFVKELPDQYLNAGVAEQNMTGLAAGLAMEGRIPVIYSIVPFATMRNFEQIRNDICYQNLNVKVVGVGAGFSYGPYGHTHHGLEDIGLMRLLPGMTIFCPADPVETQFLTKYMLKTNGAMYLRLGKAGEPHLHRNSGELKVGKGAVLQDGNHITIFSTGAVTFNSLKASQILNKKGYSTKLISVHTIKPLDKDLILNEAMKMKAVFTVEEHSAIGGLGSAIAEVISEGGIKTNFKIIGVPDRFTEGIGSQEFMRGINGLTEKAISETIVKCMQRGKNRIK